ncbi:MAG: RNA-binding S4 domain-containing protein [Propionibacteriaceae bacterium]|jgi:ribosome-associated heat shock protein Hsp15|nr:RNA-binding S4 domain-containing protein [Propionibacteriaceae bacterium]
MRIDVWLWVVRFFKSRSLATEACRAGKVRINGTVAKASAQVSGGDKVSWRDPLRVREVQVVTLLPRRVGAPEAAAAYVDFSPPLPTKAEQGTVPLRDRGAGRPEKRDRRETDRLRGYQK